MLRLRQSTLLKAPQKPLRGCWRAERPRRYHCATELQVLLRPPLSLSCGYLPLGELPEDVFKAYLNGGPLSKRQIPTIPCKSRRKSRGDR